METNELLFNLIKKLESKEIILTEGIDGVEYKTQLEGSSVLDIFLTGKVSGERIYIGRGYSKECPNDCDIKLTERRDDYLVVNDKFKENFYKEKGLINCWYKDCPNQIYQTENDYKKVKIPCSEKHTRIVCLNHNESKI